MACRKRETGEGMQEAETGDERQVTGDGRWFSDVISGKFRALAVKLYQIFLKYVN